MPSYPGEISVKALGMDVVVFAPNGTEVIEGQSGELVCRKPFPNMPVMLLNDPSRSHYHNAYFDKFPRELESTFLFSSSCKILKLLQSDVWTHGDFIRINPETKGIYVLGRRFDPDVHTPSKN